MHDLPRTTNDERRTTNQGFTLIELFITSAILFLVGIAVYSAFSNGVNVWRRCNVNRELEQNVRIVLTKISRDIRNTFEFSEIPFEGQKDTVFFPALVNEDFSSENPQGMVGRISYFFDKSKDALCKEEKAYPAVFKETDIEDGYTASLIPDVEELTFSYCYLDNATGEYEWKESWKIEEQDTIPQAIKMEFTLKKGEDESFDLTRTIFIPIGTGEQKIGLSTM